MSELAFTVNGDTFEVPNTVTGWRVRRLKPRGAPELGASQSKPVFDSKDCSAVTAHSRNMSRS